MVEEIDQAIPNKVRHQRNAIVIGDCIDMIPYVAAYDADVVRLRNIPEVRHFMNLTEPANTESQSNWRAGYESRENDIMWIIKDKSGRVCGTNRIYNISKEFCEKGSLIADPILARTAPITLESEVIAITTAFDKFNVLAIITHVRPDNAKMNSINDRFGFFKDGEVDIRGEKYYRYTLPRSSWNPLKFKAILSQWAKRFN